MYIENIGLLVRDPEKKLHENIASAERQQVRDHISRFGYFMVQAFATNDLRMIAALKLCGYETLGLTEVLGVERFMLL